MFEELCNVFRKLPKGSRKKDVCIKLRGASVTGYMKLPKGSRKINVSTPNLLTVDSLYVLKLPKGSRKVSASMIVPVL